MLHAFAKPAFTPAPRKSPHDWRVEPISFRHGAWD